MANSSRGGRALGAALSVAVLGAGVGCAEPPQGIALLRISELEGPCAIERRDFPQIPRDLEFRTVRTAGAFTGGSRWSGGHLFAAGWVEGDGAVARLQLDLGPKHGYQATYMPTGVTTDPGALRLHMQQAISYVVWRDGARVAAARNVQAVIQYVPREPDEAAGPFGRIEGRRPGTLFLHAAFDVVDEDGDTQCHIVAMHARADAARDERYDPSWHEANRGAAIVEDDQTWTAPTFEGDREPTRALIAADEAPPDPGGEPPEMDVLGNTLFDHSLGGGNACD